MSADNYFINDQNAVYYLTFTITDWVDVFTRKEYKAVVADSLNFRSFCMVFNVQSSAFSLQGS